MAPQTVNEADVWSTAIAQAIERLKKLKINFLAIDFDCTLISVHTGGLWKGSSEELAQLVRPVFVHLLTAAMQANMQVAIVTFSSQVSLIQDVLDQTLGHELSSRIPIRGSRGQWTYNGQGSQQGKQPHMASAVEELEHVREGVEITKQTTLLIDDDDKNIRVALSEGVRGLWLNPMKPNRIVKDILQLV